MSVNNTNINDIAFNLANHICKGKKGYDLCSCNVSIISGFNRFLKDPTSNTMKLPLINREDNLIKRLGC